MTKREYLKYNNPEAFDMQGKLIKPKDVVVINSNYEAIPHIGIVDHFTEGGKLAILYDKNLYGKSYKLRAYREARKVLKIKNGNNTKS